MLFSTGFLENLAIRGINAQHLERLLRLIHAPEKRTGLSYAIPNLFAAAQAALKLAPSSEQLNKLATLLESLIRNLDLFPPSRTQSDLNPMEGNYDDFPLYSLFTQIARFIEPPEFTEKFSLVTGLVLANVWLSDEPWNPIPFGYGDFINRLRRARKNEKWNELSHTPHADDLTATALRRPIASTKRDFYTKKIYDLAQQLHDRSSQSAQPATHSVTQPKAPNPRPRREFRQDLGEHDQWAIGKTQRMRPVATARQPVIAPRRIELRTRPEPQVGVDSTEDEVIAAIAEAPASDAAEELPNAPLQKLQVLDARYASEMDNQFLPYSWEALNEYDVSQLVSAIKENLENPRIPQKEKIGALIAGLSIATSRSPEELAAFGYSQAPLYIETDKPTIFIGQKCWFSPFPPLDRYKPSPDQEAWLEPVGNGVYLSIPEELVSTLSTLPSKANSLGDALGRSANELEDLAAAFCRGVRKDARSRANVYWLRSIMFHRMFALSKDEVGCVATLGNTEHAPTVGLYYSTFSPDKWRGIYDQATAYIGLTPSSLNLPPSLPYGSRQFPQEEKRKEWICNLAKLASARCATAKSLPEIAVAHNLLAGYTFLMLLAVTGHRPSDTYTFSPESIDLEGGWVIISDKVTSPSTRVRLIPLPEMAINQLKKYEAHLRNLSYRLHSENSTLAASIQLLLAGQQHTLIPMFFWLEDGLSIKPMDIRSVKSRFAWPYEGNAFRHFGATELRDERVPAEYISVLLAHIETGQFGFGKYSALSPATWKSHISPAIGRILEKQGWSVISGVSHARKALPDLTGVYQQLRKQPELDFFKKARVHVDTSKEDSKVVRTAFRNAKNITPSDAPKEDFLNAFRDEIINLSVDAPDRLARRLNFHVRYIRLHRNALKPSSIPGWAADLQVEDTPISPDSLALASAALRLRAALPETAYGFSEMNNNERIALIMVSAILYGGLLRQYLVNDLPSQLHGGIKHYAEYLWTDFPDKESGGYQRWFADKGTALLIARYLATKERAVPHKDHLRKAIAGVLLKMSQSAALSKSVETIEELIKTAHAFFMLNIPGLLRAFSCGDVRSASLSEGALLRLLSGRPLQVEAVSTEQERKSIRPHQYSSQDIKRARKILGEALKSIRDHFPASNSAATDRKGKRKNRLTALSRDIQLLSDQHSDMPSVMFAILSWADNLATDGGKAKKNLETSTIYSYTTDISRPLIEFGSEVDFLGLGEAELIDIYQRVINCGSEKTRGSRANSLRWFHEYCQEEFDMPEIDWGEVAPGMTSDSANVSANLITFAEYLAAKEFIRNHPQLNKRDRHMYEVALILLYRCGLRIGELIRLTIGDLIFEDKRILLVRNGIYGRTKTRAGIRQVPWLDRLNDEEVESVQRWISHRESIAKGDPWCAIFGEEEESRVLEIRLRMSRILIGALRAITGDPTVRIHHLRHGAGTCAITLTLSTNQHHCLFDNAIGWFNTIGAQASEEFRTFHLGIAEPTRRITWAISQALGHTTPRTTCWHYGHALDMSLHEHANSLIKLRNADIARLSGMPQNLLNVMAHQSRGKAPAEIALSWLIKKVDGLSPDTRLADHSVDKLPTYAPATIRPTSSPKIAHAILTDLASNFPRIRIADRYAKEEAEIEAIDVAARSVERRTGYLGYRNNSGDKLLAGYASKLIQPLKESLENPPQRRVLQNGIDVWMDSYSRSRPGICITHPADVKKLIKALNAIGISNDQLALIINADSDNKETAAAAIANRIRRSSRHPQKIRTPSGMQNAYTLLASLSGPTIKESVQDIHGGASLGMTKLHHLLFLAATICEHIHILNAPPAN